MSEMTTPRAQIREHLIDDMGREELRELVHKIEAGMDGGAWEVDEPLFEEYVSEVLSARADFDDEVG